jgi:hypothetical protein
MFYSHENFKKYKNETPYGPEHVQVTTERFEARPVLWICTGFNADPDPDTGFDDQNLLNLQLKKLIFF